MKIQRDFKITGFSESNGLDIKGLGSLTEDTFRVRNVPFSRNLIGKTLVATLTSTTLVDLHKVDLTEALLKKLEKSEVQERVYQSSHEKMEQTNYSARFTFAYSSPESLLPDLNLSVSSNEYAQLKKLPHKTKFRVDFKIR